MPSGGYAGEIPAWPLTDRLNSSSADEDPDGLEFLAGREAEHWGRIWRTPQAAVWVRLGWATDVALYVRWLAIAEGGDLKAGTEARQWSDRLGLNPAAMLRNRWRIAPDQVQERRVERTAADPAGVARTSARDRLRAVDGGGA